MTRLRYDGLTNTLGAALAPGDTAITFSAPLTHDAGTTVPTLAGSDYIELSILTDETIPALAEIVHLTAYTAGATTGTISRAQEGTTAVAHASGVRVINAASVQDFDAANITLTPFGTISSTNVRDALVELNQDTANLVVVVDAVSDALTAAIAVLDTKVTGPGSAVADDFVIFDGITGKLVKDSGWSRDTDGTLAANSDNRFATQKATKAYADTKAKIAQATQYTTPQTDTVYTIPTGAVELLIRGAAGGGGGGGGARTNAGSRVGGGGGGGGGYFEHRVRVADLGVSSLRVTVGAGGAAGTAPATVTGGNGGTGGNTEVKTAAGAISVANAVALATGGAGGNGGGSGNGGTQGTGGLGTVYGGFGGNGGTQTTVSGQNALSGNQENGSTLVRVGYVGCPGGGGGGCVTNTPTEGAGGGGGFLNGKWATLVPGGSVGGGAGTAGTNFTPLSPGNGGGGGGAFLTGTGGAGGAGGRAAGGGGGGASGSLSPSNGGVGGVGGDGFVEIVAIF